MSIYESPKYKVVQKEGSFEIRKYQEFYTSSVAESSLKGYSGFGVLFSYISGNNVPNQKMAMTVPVINTFDQDMTMEFVIPDDKSKQIPKPNDHNLTIKKYPERFLAVYRFSGKTDKDSIERSLNELMKWIDLHKLVTVGPVQLARYNPPFIIPLFRRNEVMIQIEYKV